MTTTTQYLAAVTLQLNTSISLVAAPRLARGSAEHSIAAYAAQYDADAAELAAEMALNRYTR